MKTSIDDGYRLLAAGYFRKQAKQLADQLDGVREAEDVEFVHRARVASRRLRAAMKLLGEWVLPKQAKRWGKEIRRVTEELGGARDRDVQIEFLCKAFSNVDDPACCPGIAHLLMHLEYQREVLQPKVVEAVDHLKASGVLGQMREAADRVLAEAGKGEAGVRTPAVMDHVREHIQRRLKRFLAYQECLADPDDQDRHHQMRIAAKRLRYTLEISRPVYDAQLDEAIAAVKNVQTLLGEIHDCDVWMAHLAAFLEEERRRMAASFGSLRPFERVKVGLEYLGRERCGTRKELFGELVEFWQSACGQGVWDRLGGTVRGETAGPADHEAPAAVAVETLREAADPGKNGNGRKAGAAPLTAQRVPAPHTGEPTPASGAPATTFGQGAGKP